MKNNNIKLTGRIYPTTDSLKTTDFIDQPETPGNVGICFSGGGSVAMISALGQMRALHHMGLLEKTRAISTVSGGSWATVPFIYLPEDISDETFLGDFKTDLSDLTLADLKKHPKGYLGSIVSQESMRATLMVAVLLNKKKSSDFPNDRIWTYIIAENILKPYGLSNMDKSDGTEATWFTYSENTAQRIKAVNQDLPDQYFTYKSNGIRRPYHLCNSAMFVVEKDTQERLVAPVQCTAIGTGIFANKVGHPWGGANVGKTVAGGGLLDSYIFDSQLKQNEGNIASVEKDSNNLFSLADITANSSAFYGVLFGDKGKGIDPTYDYWSPDEAGTSEGTGFATKFTDGGAADNNGLLNLLAYEDIERAVVFTNALQPIYCDNKNDKAAPNFNIVVDQWLPPYFGYMPYLDHERCKSLNKKIEKTCKDKNKHCKKLQVGYNKYSDFPAVEIMDENIHYFRKNQVFHSELFADVLANFAKVVDSDWSTPPILELENLELLLNPWYNIREGRTLKKLLLFHYGPIKGWKNQLQAEVQSRLKEYTRGIARKKEPTEALKHVFPNFSLTDTYMPAPIANLFAHFTAYVTHTQRCKLEAIFSK
ncbi:MAG: hypothetical protein AAGJ18_03840 [Bacteroidota bacterium]